jgi:imidazoleglycerol-phosphate dehydratase
VPERNTSVERIEKSRKTKETDISVALSLEAGDGPEIATGVPFFDHMLTAFGFHGGFGLSVRAAGDLEVDAHHTVEDVGLVLGDAFSALAAQQGALTRYGSALIPMDDALSEVAVDVSGRPFLVYQASYPQDYAGTFDLSLVREFFLALSNRAAINMHATCRYGVNGHHMAESLFKAAGIALRRAYHPVGSGGGARSTKGTIG